LNKADSRPGRLSGAGLIARTAWAATVLRVSQRRRYFQHEPKERNQTMTNDIRLPWILAGYHLFASEGPKGLKVEVIARQVNKSKSSFYHHFADLEVFTEILLNHHLERAKRIAERERLCKNVIPDLLNLLLEIKQDLLFNRQLRINRNISQFKQCFEKSSTEVGEAILGIWAEALGLRDNSNLARIVLKLSLENFYLQITAETLTYKWLLNYVNELQNMVKEFKKEEKRESSFVR
jgi:AcrR family transcriptional regulator